MNYIGTFSLALTFAGCFLGAGYVSGQELWQFFGAFGSMGPLGLLLAIGLQCFFGVVLLRLGRDTGLEDPDKIVIRREIPALRGFVGAAEVFFMYGVCIIMYAGAGALLAQTLGLPQWAGSAILSLLVALISLRGFAAMVRAFSLLVPLLVIFTVGFSGAALLRYGFPGFPEPEPAANPLLQNWGISSLTFVSYNLFCSIGILTPLARRLKSRRMIPGGVSLGCAGLFAIAFSILAALSSHPESLSAQLPMLALAQELSPAAGAVYALVLLCSMFGTALSCHVAAVEYLCRRSSSLRKRHTAAAGVTAFLGWCGSLAGFDTLIGFVYPLCGYCGFLALLGIIDHAHHIKKEMQYEQRTCNN
ncbi:MAG: hypothetical protein ACOX81_03795 [Candidatus Heteroscillospira sp.]|jgi:uncharacterized membrane protein YkvI